jgi:hypothetical protein
MRRDMKGSLWGYIKAAFNARPLGMFVAPNWIALLGIGLLGIQEPGVWLIGAGLELAYLYFLSTNRRFQNVVDATTLQKASAGSTEKLQAMIGALGEPDRQRYRLLERRCQAILEQQKTAATGDAFTDLQSQGEGLGKLLWIYLRLLNSRQAFARLLKDSGGDRAGGDPLERRAERLRLKLQDPRLSDDLRKSLTGQLEILQQRAKTQREADEKLTFLDAELSRVEQQVELIREQAVLSSDPAAVSSRIDQIAATLTGTSQWIRDQQQAYGQVADVLEEPSPVIVAARESA